MVPGEVLAPGRVSSPQAGLSGVSYIRWMLWTVDLSEEVREWYLGLTPAGKAAADRIVTRLESVGNQLRMPHSRPLGDGLYELRFTCENVARRIAYVFEPQRRAVTLTTFRKRRSRTSAEKSSARGERKLPAQRNSGGPRTWGRQTRRRDVLTHEDDVLA